MFIAVVCNFKSEITNIDLYSNCMLTPLIFLHIVICMIINNTRKDSILHYSLLGFFTIRKKNGTCVCCLSQPIFLQTVLLKKMKLGQ